MSVLRVRHSQTLSMHESSPLIRAVLRSPHPALDPSQNQIRLLRFDLKAYNKNPNDLYLRHTVFAVDKCPTFTALSYTWGSKDNGDYIILNGQPFHVQRNLADALVAFHDHVRDYSALLDLVDSRTVLESNTALSASFRWLWIDALCIDQCNVEERNHQVGLMSQIYSCAASVVVWMGLECVESIQCLTSNLLSPLTLAEETTLQKFLASSYWQRAWTIQEFELAKEVHFAAGRHLISLLEACERFEDIGLMPDEADLRDRGIEVGSRHKHWQVLNRLRDRGRLKDTPLKDLVIRFKDMQCEDPRDTIYALLGLAAADENQLEPDYSLSASQLCAKLPEHGIELWRISNALRDAAKEGAVQSSKATDPWNFAGSWS